MQAVKRVLIVGGGTAGWLTAAFLAKTLGAAGDNAVRISVVESPEIGIVGVGEGSFPSIKGTLAAIGIDEARFLRRCHGTFKQGVKFVDWVRPAGTPGHRHYFHPFSAPSQRTGSLELLPYWLQGAAGADTAFADAVTMQAHVVEAGRAPKRIGDPDFAGPLNYAYHFDAAELAALLKEQALALGVRHIAANVTDVAVTEGGNIETIGTGECGRLDADLYIDCSGFRALLIGGALRSPFKSLRDTLFVDRALAFQVPYEGPDAPIPPCTISTAHEAGWTWDIGLQQRRGVGYVYSSRHSDDSRAEEVLRRYAGPGSVDLNPRLLKFEVGYRPVQWVGNCVAVGLSSGFLEPLESSGVGLIETAAYLISYLFPHNGDFAPVARQFNDLMRGRYERIVDFIKMHYCLTQRTDSAFWTDNADPASIPSTLQDKLAMWRCRPPHRLDFVADMEMYLTASWQYVLYGMEFRTALQANSVRYPRMEEARQEFKAIREVSRRALDDLPPHRALLDHYCGNQPAGMSPRRVVAV